MTRHRVHDLPAPTPAPPAARETASKPWLPGAPEAAREFARSDGEPLDTTTRAFMERGFGHDFSRIRVHADADAASIASSEGALAFAAGDHVGFAAGGYRPHTPAGRAVLAHELAHTVQQQGPRGGGEGESASMERSADRAAATVLLGGRADVPAAPTAPAVQFLRVTDGALGKALEVYTIQESVPDQAIVLLRKSPTFMKLAKTIDANYVWRTDSFEADRYAIDPLGPDGRLKSGPFRGRRELFDVLWGKPRFEPIEAPPEHGYIKLTGDIISLWSNTVPEFIQELAHEVTHCARFVGVATPAPKTLADEINAGVTEEVETRKSEAKILGEIPDKAVSVRTANVGSRVPAEVERDISPAFGMTYLENFAFGGLMREAQKADGLTDRETEDIRDEVEKQVKVGSKVAFVFKPRPEKSGIVDTSKYADVWIDRRTTQLEWEQFGQKHSPIDPDFETEKEKLVQDHAKRFFKGRAAYSPLPAKAATP